MANGSGSGQVLGRRALNRATLERQMLLARTGMPVLDAVGHLIALNAQDPNLPYLSLWARLVDFDRDWLTGMLYDRSVVRSSVVRGTQHIVTAKDFLWLRPLMGPVLARARQAAFGRKTAGMDLLELADAARELLAGRTLTRTELGKLLVERWPDRDPTALAWSAQSLVPFVHPPPSGTWGTHGATPFTLAEEWLRRPMASTPSLHKMVRRYLAAFGPAGVMDVQAWSGVTRLRSVVEDLKRELRTFRDESGTELYDLPEAPRPDPDVPAPPRFLPYFDNPIMAHADRTRVMTLEYRKRICVGAVVAPTFTIDGFVRGTWDFERSPDAVSLVIQPFEKVAKGDADSLSEEGSRLLTFSFPGTETRDIRLLPPG